MNSNPPLPLPPAFPSPTASPSSPSVTVTTFSPATLPSISLPAAPAAPAAPFSVFSTSFARPPPPPSPSSSPLRPLPNLSAMASPADYSNLSFLASAFLDSSSRLFPPPPSSTTTTTTTAPPLIRVPLSLPLPPAASVVAAVAAAAAAAVKRPVPPPRMDRPGNLSSSIGTVTAVAGPPSLGGGIGAGLRYHQLSPQPDWAIEWSLGQSQNHHFHTEHGAGGSLRHGSSSSSSSSRLFEFDHGEAPSTLASLHLRRPSLSDGIVTSPIGIGIHTEGDLHIPGRLSPLASKGGIGAGGSGGGGGGGGGVGGVGDEPDLNYPEMAFLDSSDFWETYLLPSHDPTSSLSSHPSPPPSSAGNLLTASSSDISLYFPGIHVEHPSHPSSNSSSSSLPASSSSALPLSSTSTSTSSSSMSSLKGPYSAEAMIGAYSSPSSSSSQGQNKRSLDLHSHETNFNFSGYHVYQEEEGGVGGGAQKKLKASHVPSPAPSGYASGDSQPHLSLPDFGGDVGHTEEFFLIAQQAWGNQNWWQGLQGAQAGGGSGSVNKARKDSLPNARYFCVHCSESWASLPEHLMDPDKHVPVCCLAPLQWKCHCCRRKSSPRCNSEMVEINTFSSSFFRGDECDRNRGPS